MLLLIQDARLRDGLAKNATRFVVRNNWGLLKKKYFEIVDTLVAKSTHHDELELKVN